MNNFPSAEFISIIITAIGVVIVNIIIASRTHQSIQANTNLTELVNKKADTISNKTIAIEHHVNSAASLAAAKIDALEKQIVELIRDRSEKKEIASLAAQSATTEKIIKLEKTL